MNKVATYLQEHVLGEVTVHPAILKAMSNDASILEIKPEMVIYPRVTNDIRKIARFSWQLAEKKHILPLTVRGGGTDKTGAAIGKGIILVTTSHMNRIFELDTKQKLTRVQPGVSTRTLNNALMLQGVAIPPLSVSDNYTTIGGAVANNKTGISAGKYGDIHQWVQQLEIVLANGDILQTGRLNKRELNKKKGLQTFEGEIYRNLDNLIEDNKDLIKEKIAANLTDNAGYSSIVKVKRHDGSFDLTPLFIGSQGTLGIISEMIVKCEFMSEHDSVLIAGFASHEVARDVLNQLEELEPAFIDYYSGELFAQASLQGRKYAFTKDMSDLHVALLVGFDDFNERARQRKLKKAKKLLEKVDAHIESINNEDVTELLAVQEVTAYSLTPSSANISTPPLFDGAYIPSERFEEFSIALSTLANKHGVTLPIHGRMLSRTLYIRPDLQLHKVSDKQKVFKLLDEYSDLVEQFGGHLIGESAEGRVKARFAYKHLDPKLTELFASVKSIFDPYGVLNPDVKQDVEIRTLASKLRSDYNTANFPSSLPYN